MKPTITMRRPAATSASRIRSQASRVVASGFSQNTCLPAAMPASTNSSCVGPQDATTTASTSGPLIRSWPVLWTVAPVARSATDCARSMSASVTAATRAPESTCVSLRMWSWPIIPTPMTPTLTVTGDSFRQESALVGPAPDRTEPAGHEVAGGPRGDRQGDVGLHRVEVLLDDGEQVGAELAESLQQRGHGRIPVGRFHHGAELHRLGQRQVLAAHPLADLRVHLLEMHVADPLGSAADDRDVVATAVGDVPGVQAQVDVPRIGVGQELLDALLGVDMGVDMRVEHQLDAVLLEHHPAQLVGAADQ